MLAAGSWYFSNQLHPAFLAQRTQRDVDAGERYHHLLERVGHCAHLRGYFEQAPDEVQIGCAVAVRQKAIMSDSDKALWQSVEQKPVDKFNGADCGLLYNSILTIFIPEAHPTIFKVYEARVGDRYPVGVTGQVFKYVSSLSNGLPHTDDPLVVIESVFELLVSPDKGHFSPAGGPCELADELTPKNQ
jgi:hypothetical protein